MGQKKSEFDKVFSAWDILINSDFLGIQGTAEYLEDLIAKKYGKKEA